MLSLFQETLEDVVGQLFKPDKVRPVFRFIPNDVVVTCILFSLMSRLCYAAADV